MSLFSNYKVHHIDEDLSTGTPKKPSPFKELTDNLEFFPGAIADRAALVLLFGL
jgi:hypothetical protein